MPKSPRKRRPFLTTRTTLLGRDREQRILIPQSPFRPLILTGRDALKSDAMKDETWWFIEHRKGVYRPNIGEDPLEARAVSKSSIRGTLPERIVYKYLISVLRLQPGADFDFQTSLFGGRLELGGIVADFMFNYQKIVLQVQGPTHTQFIRTRKDDEQWSALAAMGYTVYFLEEKDIYSELKFDQIMRKIFFLGRGGGGGTWQGYQEQEALLDTPTFAYTEYNLDAIMVRLNAISRQISEAQEVVGRV